MESIASKLKTKRESLNISLEQISKDTRIIMQQLESLENGRYADLPGGMYNRAILRTYCDALGLDKNEILRCYDGEIARSQEKPIAPSHSSKTKILTAVLWTLIFIFGICIFLNREWIISELSSHFSSDYGGDASGLQSEQPYTKTVNTDAAVDAAADIQAAEVIAETAPADSTGDADKVVEAPPKQTPQSAPAVDTTSPFRLEIVSKEECWISVESDGARAVIKTLSPGDVEFFTATRTISLVIGNAGGVSLRINDRAARTLGKSGERKQLTINKDTLPDIIGRSAS